MKSVILLFLGILLTNFSFGQKNADIPELDTRIGLGAVIGTVGFNAELSLEKDFSKRWYGVGRIAVWPKYSYGLRWGLHYKLLRYKRSYLSIGSEFFYARHKDYYSGLSFKNIFYMEFPLSFNIAFNKNLLLELGMASSFSIFHEPYFDHDAYLLGRLRAGVKYRINR